MGRPARKMVNLSIEETSGVDHPAHLHEGWLVMKAASPDSVDEAISDSEQPPVEQTEEVLMENEQIDVDVEKADKPSYEDLAAALEKANARIAEMEKEMAGAAPEKEDDEEDMMKSAPESVRKAYEALQKAADEAAEKAEAAEAELRKERAERADAEAVVKAREAYANLGLDAEMVGPALRRLADSDADLAKSVEDVLTAANAKVESADIFTEIGKSARPSGTAYEKAEAMAKAAVAEGSSATFEQALTDVFASDSDLYMSYLNEQGK